VQVQEEEEEDEDEVVDDAPRIINVRSLYHESIDGIASCSMSYAVSFSEGHKYDKQIVSLLFHVIPRCLTVGSCDRLMIFFSRN
jgi:hypothetical protein